VSQVRDPQAERFAQARVDRRGQRREVCFSFRDRGFGGGAVPFAALRVLGDGFKIALQRPGVGGRDQALAGAATGDEQGGCHAEQPGEQDSQVQMAAGAVN